MIPVGKKGEISGNSKLWSFENVFSLLIFIDTASTNIQAYSKQKPTHTAQIPPLTDLPPLAADSQPASTDKVILTMTYFQDPFTTYIRFQLHIV